MIKDLLAGIARGLRLEYAPINEPLPERLATFLEELEGVDGDPRASDGRHPGSNPAWVGHRLSQGSR
jgi:hypothetical protein